MDVTLKPLSDHELELLFAWRKIPYIWEYLPSYDVDGLSWPLHYAWFHSTRKTRADWIIFVDDDYTRKRAVGSTHVDLLDTDSPEVGIFIADKSIWGKGVGYQALSWTVNRVVKMGHKRVFAVIHPVNLRSISLFHKVGFIRVGGARNGQDLYKYTVSGPEIPVPGSEARDRRSYQPVPA